MNNKDRWSQLSMQQRADLIKLYINNGVTSIGDIRNHYNSFGDGGDTSSASEKLEDILETTPKQFIQALKGYAMAQARAHQSIGSYALAKKGIDAETFTLKHHLEQAKRGEFEDPGQDAFLFSRKEQEKAFLNSGYHLENSKDYGLVKKAVGDRDLPIYKKNEDIIPRDSLTVIANPDIWLGDVSEELEHPGYAPTALYVDKDGNFYQQSWDLQDYGIQSAGSKGASYSPGRQVIANIIDIVGNPVVRKSGIRPVKNIKEGIMQLSGSSNAGNVISKVFEYLPEEEKNNIVQDILETQYVWMLKDPEFSSSISQEKFNNIKQELKNNGRNYDDISVYMNILPFDEFKHNLNKYFTKETLYNLGIPTNYYDKFDTFTTKEGPYTPIYNYDASYRRRKNNGGKLNKFATGGPTEEILNSNTNEPLITREEYLNRQRQAIINQSIENSNNRELPTVPYILEYPDEETWRSSLTKELEEARQTLKQALENNWDDSFVEMYKTSIDSIQKKLNQGYKAECIPGASCIYTATDNYGNKYRVSGNRSFRSSPEKYGFTEINLNDIRPGDIIQDFSVNGSPTHAITFMGYNDGGTALYNYSSGDHTKGAIRKNKKYPFYTMYGDELHLNNEDNTDLRTYAAAYRFIGNNEDNNLWNQEYNDYRSNYTRNIVNQLKSVPKLPQPNVRQLSSLGIERKNGGKVDRFDEGGKIDIKYPLDATTGNGEKYSDIIMQREHDAYNALLRNGYSIEDARRLSPILTAQSLYETGWRLSDKNNNYAGYLDSKGNKLKYDSAEEFWDSHLKNLSNRWSNWDTARNVEDYYNIVNQTHLNLKSKEDYNRYKKDNPNTFIYSPTWENTDYKRRLLSTSARVQSYLDRLSMNKDFPLNNNTQPFIDKSLFPVEFYINKFGN